MRVFSIKVKSDNRVILIDQHHSQNEVRFLYSSPGKNYPSINRDEGTIPPKVENGNFSGPKAQLSQECLDEFVAGDINCIVFHLSMIFCVHQLIFIIFRNLTMISCGLSVFYKRFQCIAKWPLVTNGVLTAAVSLGARSFFNNKRAFPIIIRFFYWFNSKHCRSKIGFAGIVFVKRTIKNGAWPLSRMG